MAGDIVFGLNAVSEALRAGRGINRIYIAKESHARGVDPLLDEARARKVPFDFVPQAKLNELGFNVGAPDGAGGPKTTNALRAFQKDRGIPVTGRLDNATKSELAK